MNEYQIDLGRIIVIVSDVLQSTCNRLLSSKIRVVNESKLQIPFTKIIYLLM